MTREEALKILKEPDRIGYNIIRANDEETVKYNTKSQMALYMAIKALEREPVLDKVREEIENTMKYQYAIGENQYAEGFEKSLEIIDKYEEKSEEKE